MNDETRKALDKIFASDSGKLAPLGASGIGRCPAGTNRYVGLFQVHGSTLNKLHQLYDDAIAADDAAKIAADAKAQADAKAADAKNRAGDER